MNIKLFDSNFFGLGELKDTSVSHIQTPTYFNWVKDENIDENDIVFFTDRELSKVDNCKPCKRKIAFLLEPPAIYIDSYKYIEENYHKFDFVISYIKMDIPNFLFAPNCMCWILPSDQKIYHKNRNVSIIASSKNLTDGHQLRHQVIQKYQKLHIYGNGYNFIKSKLPALKQYRYSIVIENSSIDNYFTEKIIDCFVTGTIPIYWGCKNISNFFNEKGMYIFNDINELDDILKKINKEDYDSKLPYIQDNFNRSMKYRIGEDWIYENYSFLFSSN